MVLFSSPIFYFLILFLIIISTECSHQGAISFLRWYVTYHRQFPFPHLSFLGGQKLEESSPSPGHLPTKARVLCNSALSCPEHPENMFPAVVSTTQAAPRSPL